SFFFQAEDGIRDFHVTGVQTCALPICKAHEFSRRRSLLLPEAERRTSAVSIGPCSPQYTHDWPFLNSRGRASRKRIIRETASACAVSSACDAPRGCTEARRDSNVCALVVCNREKRRNSAIPESMPRWIIATAKAADVRAPRPLASARPRW